MQDQDENKPTGEIGYSLDLRNNYSTNLRNQDHPMPETAMSYRFLKLRQGATFKPEDIIKPEVSSSIFLKLATQNATDEEIRTTAGKIFDGANFHLYEKSKGSEKALGDYSESLGRRQHGLEKDTEETPPLRSMYSAKDLVKLSKAKLMFGFLTIIVIVGLVVLEWSSQATLIQMSGDEVFLGEGGYIKALLVTPVLIIFTLFLKFAIKDFEPKAQRNIRNLLLIVLSSCAIAYFLAFSFYYGGMLSLDDDSLKMPPEVWRKIMIFAQLVLAPFSTMFIFNAIEKRAEYHKEEAVFYNKKHLALDEELGSIVARREDTDFTIKHFEGFRAGYLHMKEMYIEEFYGEYTDFKTAYLSATCTAIVNFRKNRTEEDKKPKLRIVGDEE